MSDRNERSDRLRKRFDRSDSDADAGGGDAVASTSDASGRGEQTPVKERPSVLMYLPEETRRELDIRFDELNARHKREYGEPLEKNRDYYPAVIRAGLEGRSVEDVLEL